FATPCFQKHDISPHAHSNFQTCSSIQIWFCTFILENVLEMIGAKWAAILPLRIASPIAFSNSDPVMLADRLTWPGIRLFEPWNNERCFRFELTVRDIIVR